ncbi:hypothetical protein CAPTEDRAFT_225734 [Capitella teleta]|uniref:Uncharacterized protein n=1 Tax=Capitella teleta TaxID=283909 RepID=R7VFP1_CAPTE|nr:hypothetical protein CAPTEDRAFT_225734 [Capitella teleta]|eukprot:ELU17392.1 hypothetical protein CAPTEDRAFT_225734 [Capitella teleta]
MGEVYLNLQRLSLRLLCSWHYWMMKNAELDLYNPAITGIRPLTVIEELVVQDRDVAQEEDEMEDEELEEDSSDKENDGKKGMELRYEYKEGYHAEFPCWNSSLLKSIEQMNIVSMMSVVMISTHVLVLDRAFLLQLQFANESLEKPTNLPGLDVILDAPMRHNEQPRGDRGPPSMKQMIDFTPGFVKSSPSGSKGQMGPGGVRSQSRRLHLSLQLLSSWNYWMMKNVYIS